MRIVHISDTHNRHKKMEIPECDVLIHSGDFSGMGYSGEVEPFMKWFMKQYNATYKILVAGNHDISFDILKHPEREFPDWWKKIMGDYLDNGLNYYLNDTGQDIEGIKFWGSPITPRFGGPQWAFNRDRGSDIKYHWDKIPEGTDVLITHGPPHKILDWVPTYTTRSGFVRQEEHTGCIDLYARILEIKPKFSLFGHIHEGYGKVIEGETTFLNSSICTEQYEPTNKPQIFDI